MQTLDEKNILCPYCGEAIQVLVDPQDLGQEYIEDCQVCCKPIVFKISTDSMGNILVSVRDENEAH